MPFGILVGLAAPKAVLVKYTFSRNGTFKLDPRRGKAGTVESVWLDEIQGLRISIRGHEGKWPVSTIKFSLSD